MSESYTGKLTKITDFLYEYEYKDIKAQINDFGESSEFFRFKAVVKSDFFDIPGMNGEDIEQVALSLDYKVDELLNIYNSIKVNTPNILKKSVVHAMQTKPTVQQGLIELINNPEATQWLVELIDLGPPENFINPNGYHDTIATLLSYLLNKGEEKSVSPSEKIKARASEELKIRSLLAVMSKGTSNPKLSDLIDLAIESPKVNNDRTKSLEAFKNTMKCHQNLYLADLLSGYLWGLENKDIFEPISQYNFEDAKVLGTFNTSKSYVRHERKLLQYVEFCFGYIPKCIWELLEIFSDGRKKDTMQRHFQKWKVRDQKGVNF